MAAKRKKKSTVAPTKAPRREEPHIVFPASMKGSKPKAPSVASEQKRTKAAEADARKRKLKNTIDNAPPTKKRKTKKRDQAAPKEPLVVEPISFAHPTTENQEHDEVLPQIERPTVSSLVLTNSELISIGRPLTPISQDASWADRPQPATPSQDSPSTPRPSPAPVISQIANDDNYMETTPSPKASPVFQRLRKGLRPSVSMTTITEEDSNQSSSVARQVFPEDNPSVTVPMSEAHASEDNPAASTDERQGEEEHVATPPTTQEVVLEENVSVPDPPATQVEVENPEAATNNNTEANDVVMAEDNVEPAMNTVPKANDAPATNEQPDAPTNATAPVPPPRPHTIE
nr:proteoglycan 4-like [Aegilops tauschii subsp. strangulata]